MSPTHESFDRFERDFAALSKRDRELFLLAVRLLAVRMVRDDLARVHFRKGLRIKKVQGSAGIFEMTFAPDGRATWQFGNPVIDGEPHIIWRRVGTHAILGHP